MSDLKFTLFDVTSFLSDNLPGPRKIIFMPAVGNSIKNTSNQVANTKSVCRNKPRKHRNFSEILFSFFHIVTPFKLVFYVISLPEPNMLCGSILSFVKKYPKLWHKYKTILLEEQLQTSKHLKNYHLHIDIPIKWFWCHVLSQIESCVWLNIQF